MNRFPQLQGSLLLPTGTFPTHWMLPLLVVRSVEGGGFRELGFTVKRDDMGRYGVYAMLGLVLPTALVGLDRLLVFDSLEQIIQIGFAEEIFFREYLLRRLAGWLGDRKGLALGTLAFGFAHIVSRISQHELAYPVNDAMLSFQTAIGGLTFGYIYLRARSILPGGILHISVNLYLGRMTSLLTM
jgi:hypothetical protein